VATIDIPEEEVVDFLVFLKKVQQRHRFLERYLGKRIPVDHNSKIVYLIEQLEANVMNSGLNEENALLLDDTNFGDDKKVM
jgi:hypothetical protein